MMLVYDVKLGEETVGQATMEKRGLYYTVRCSCRFLEGIFRLVDRCDHGEVSVGICGPVAGGLGISRNIPAKKLDSGSHVFRLLPQGNSQGDFYPLDPQKPCPLADRLEQTRFAIREGVAGLIFAE